MKYNTAGRRRVVAVMAQHPERPYTVEELYEAMGDGEVGKSSLYRLVETLCREGVLRKFREQGQSAATFQYVGDVADCHTHLHLKCTGCGRLIHLECAMSTELLAHIQAHHGFCVDTERSALWGLCADCREKEEDRETL